MKRMKFLGFYTFLILNVVLSDLSILNPIPHQTIKYNSSFEYKFLIPSNTFSNEVFSVTITSTLPKWLKIKKTIKNVKESSA